MDENFEGSFDLPGKNGISGEMRWIMFSFTALIVGPSAHGYLDNIAFAWSGILLFIFGIFMAGRQTG